MIALIIIGFCIVVITLILDLCLDDKSLIPLFWTFTIFGTLIMFVGIDQFTHHDDIKPIEVYKGNTTLQYTIVDGVIIDSTVVWKPYKE